MARVRIRQRLGKYRIDRRIAEGGFATVYRALDTVADIAIAIKVPNDQPLKREALDDFRKEVRLSARLDHPNILPVKDATVIDGVFVVVYPLGEKSLADRLANRMSIRTIIAYAEQMLDAVAFAHRHRIMHCDIKPENFIVFKDDRLRLADFGIAKAAHRTLVASGSGTVGYIAPEQAMGKPSFRSDVFSLGLILYRMFSGRLPEWPFEWPPPAFDRIRKSLHKDLIVFLRRSLEVNHRKRYTDAVTMLAAFKRVRAKALRSRPVRRNGKKKAATAQGAWRTMRQQEMLKRYRKPLELTGSCHRCRGPVSEAMRFCPLCGVERRIDGQEHRFRGQCPRCKRSMKTDWRFCPWCYGPAINPDSSYRHSDVRYTARCSNAACVDKVLMPFMCYCPWCRRKVRKRWKIEGATDRCPRCRWDVLPDYWDFCAWCARGIRKK